MSNLNIADHDGIQQPLLMISMILLFLATDIIPDNCYAVAQVNVELLTGRTHQIRGQLAAEGHPLVGDAAYGGAKIRFGDNEEEMKSGRFFDSERLALQCSGLSFLDPDIIANDRGDARAVPSTRWKSYELKEAWWTPCIERYKEQIKNLASDNDYSTYPDNATLDCSCPMSGVDKNQK